MPPMAGLQGICATVSSDSVTTATRAPSRAAAAAASTPACPAPTTSRSRGAAAHRHLPMQNEAKTSSSRSSVATTPISASSSRAAQRKLSRPARRGQVAGRKLGSSPLQAAAVAVRDRDLAAEVGDAASHDLGELRLQTVDPGAGGARHRQTARIDGWGRSPWTAREAW